MDYKSLHYMLVLQEEGLLSLAARRLGISQSSLSLFLLRLEQQYQTPLYDRKKHCMTEAGRIYCEGAGKVLLLHDKALEDIRTLSEHPSFSLGFPVCMNESLAPLTAALIRESALCDPLVSLRISFFPEQRLREMLQQNEFDLIYSYFPRSGIDTLNRQSLLKEPLLLGCSPGLPLQGTRGDFPQPLLYCHVSRNHPPVCLRRLFLHASPFPVCKAGIRFLWLYPGHDGHRRICHASACRGSPLFFRFPSLSGRTGPGDYLGLLSAQRSPGFAVFRLSQRHLKTAAVTTFYGGDCL